MHHVIVGDGVAGHTAAKTIREQDPDADITVLTSEGTPFYDRIGLRAYIHGGRDRDALVLKGEDWYAENGIDIRLGTRVEAIDREAQTVATENDNLRYDRLLLATGSSPRTLPFEPGVAKAHHLWELEQDGDPLKQDLDGAEKAVAVGGGLLGFDLIGAFATQDVDAHYLIREDHWWQSVLDETGGRIVHDAMADHGIEIRTNTEATDMQEEDGVVRIETNSGELDADVVGLAVGNTPNVELAAETGLAVDDGIVVDELLQTDDPHIYAAGDCAAYQDVILGKRHRTGSWVSAQAQGEHAARNMCGAAEPFRHVDQYTVSHFGLHIASLGDPVHTADHEVITAVDGERYRKLVLDGDRIVGAAFIGEMRWLHPLQQLIEQQADVSGQRDVLADVDADINDLL